MTSWGRGSCTGIGGGDGGSTLISGTLGALSLGGGPQSLRSPPQENLCTKRLGDSLLLLADSSGGVDLICVLCLLNLCVLQLCLYFTNKMNMTTTMIRVTIPAVFMLE